MAVKWEEIYSGYTADELRDERVSLKKQLAHGYESQTTGGKSYQKNLNHLTDRFQSLTRVMKERGVSVDGSSDSAAVGSRTFIGQVDMGTVGLDDF